MQSSPAATEVQAACELDSLLSFISAAAEANIVSGVQVNLLNDLAGQWCSRKGCKERLSEAAPVEQQQAAGTDHPAALAGSTLQHHPAEVALASHSKLVPTSLPEAPQLHIQPLNLSAGLHAHSSTSAQAQQEAAGLRAALAPPAAGLPGSDPAAEGLSSHAAALMALTGSMAGVAFDPAAAAAAALLQSQAFSHGAAVTSSGQALGESCPAGTSFLGPSHGLLQALGYTSDPAAAGPAVGTATAAEPTTSKAPAYRKQRFTREQHAAILESVERNFAQYPSRYTELVIKEMQARFPGIELNNACVRKIKFRANEANKLQHTQQPQQDIAGALEHQAAADAAHGLVGLASAAAAAAVAAAAAADAACTLQPVAATEPTGRSSSMGGEPEEGRADPGNQQTAATTSPAGAATAGDPALKLQSEHSDSPETVSLGTEPSCAALLAPGPTPQQQQQHGTQVQEQGGSGDAAAASLSNSPALVLKLPQVAEGAVGSSPAAGVEDVVDSATAAAAEAMHLLASISSSAKQQPAAPTHRNMPAAAAAAGASRVPGSAAGGVAAAAAPVGPFVGGTSKRKWEAASGAADCEVSTSGTATSSPLSGQVAEALSAAADLAGSVSATQHQLGLQQAADAAPGPMSASLDQQQLMQRLLQQQQLQSPWDLAAYNSQLTPLDLQLQQQQQALQFQLGNGLAGSSGMLQGPSAAAAAAAVSAAAGGQQPAAKRQRLSGAQMAELIASVKHHVQANPERYTHCVIKDMKDKYPDLELNMGQIRKIKFRTLGNANTSKQAGKSASEPSSAAGGGAGSPFGLDAAGGLSGAAAAAATAAGMRQ